MKKFNVFSLLLFVVMATGCAIKSPVVIPKIQHSEITNIRSESIMLYLDDQLLNQRYEIKQLLTIFQYELGDYFKNAIHDSLKSSFPNIVVAESKQSGDYYDVVITPELEFFEAPVPPLVTMSTETKVVLKYHVTPKAPLVPYTLIAEGTYELKNKQDQDIYQSLAGSDIYYYDISSGVGMAFPDYSYEAGKDTYIAIYHALEALKMQLVDKFIKF